MKNYSLFLMKIQIGVGTLEVENCKNVSFGTLAAEMKLDGDIIGVSVCPMRDNFYMLDVYQEQAIANLCDRARGVEGPSNNTNNPAIGANATAN